MIKITEEILTRYVSLLIASRRVIPMLTEGEQIIIAKKTKSAFFPYKVNSEGEIINSELPRVPFVQMLEMIKEYQTSLNNERKKYDKGFRHLSYSTQLLPDFFNYLEECYFDEVMQQENIPTAIEGKRRLVENYVLSRNPKLVEEAKIRDIYTCQACGYHKSINGIFIIDCHHITPLFLTGERETKIDDLVCLCPNCHRIAHSKMPPLNLDEIKNLLNIN
ncbi:HNH endonuclease [Thorsellia anophelis]|uniref:HNH endonuclease n=1 Tax=Thorsellia anophelis DSM 18579 TaxID=1123402 RepID=A0A1I0FU97_9GAMM|nr:HNH endonuclease [Thorsellia anophelis]SET62029.1 HNH endonuclease [Thorsellia anophelis DSM 18579]